MNLKFFTFDVYSWFNCELYRAGPADSFGNLIVIIIKTINEKMTEIKFIKIYILQDKHVKKQNWMKYYILLSYRTELKGLFGVGVSSLARQVTCPEF